MEEKKWMLIITSNNIDLVNEYRETKGLFKIDVGNWNYMFCSGYCNDELTDNYDIITDEDFIKITGISKIINKVIHIPEGKTDCVVIRCIKDCYKYNKGDITWNKKSQYVLNGVLYGTLHPEDNKHCYNYNNDCFELYEPISDKKEISLPNVWYYKITHENLPLVNLLRDYLGYGQYSTVYVKDHIGNDGLYRSSYEVDYSNIISDSEFKEYLKSKGISINIFPVEALKQQVEDVAFYFPEDVESEHYQEVYLENLVVEKEPKKKTIQVEMIPVKQRRII